MHGEEVKLTMPAMPQLLRIARLTAAGLAGRLGFNFDEIEDVKIAVDELCFALVGTKGHDGDLTVTYRLLPDALEIEGTGALVDGATHPVPNELSAQILAAVVDEHDLSTEGDSLRFRLRKNRLRS
ncbi:MAG: serine/threonine-protein kinase RsbW [Actinomycetota bacterium]|jgi:hypothetical protein|nr:serine/threonine-protein kinase RsbW [Actinomycetota bacterium]